jgi:hypothetical protein
MNHGFVLNRSGARLRFELRFIAHQRKRRSVNPGSTLCWGPSPVSIFWLDG